MTNKNTCASCAEWKDPKLVHVLHEDGLISPPVKNGTCCNIKATYYKQVTENIFVCESYTPKMLLG